MTPCLIRMLAISSIPEVHQGEWHQRLLGGDLPKSETMSGIRTSEGVMTSYGFVLLTGSLKVLFRKLNCSPDIDGILPKGPYLPCLRMEDRALLAG